MELLALGRLLWMNWVLGKPLFIFSEIIYLEMLLSCSSVNLGLLGRTSTMELLPIQNWHRVFLEVLLVGPLWLLQESLLTSHLVSVIVICSRAVLLNLWENKQILDFFAISEDHLCKVLLIVRCLDGIFESFGICFIVF